MMLIARGISPTLRESFSHIRSMLGVTSCSLRITMWWSGRKFIVVGFSLLEQSTSEPVSAIPAEA